MKENGYPASNQKRAFTLAKELGYKITAHAGEEVGADGIWDFLNICDADRIDHGLRAVEDEKLINYLADRNILLTLCPDSNICLGTWPSWKDYPLPILLSHGVKVSINSDDPPFLRLNLTENMQEVSERFQLSQAEMLSLIENALKYNFAGQEHLSKIAEWKTKNVI